MRGFLSLVVIALFIWLFWITWEWIKRQRKKDDYKVGSFKKRKF